MNTKLLWAIPLGVLIGGCGNTLSKPKIENCTVIDPDIRCTSSGQQGKPIVGVHLRNSGLKIAPNNICVSLERGQNDPETILTFLITPPQELDSVKVVAKDITKAPWLIGLNDDSQHKIKIPIPKDIEDDDYDYFIFVGDICIDPRVNIN